MFIQSIIVLIAIASLSQAFHMSNIRSNIRSISKLSAAEEEQTVTDLNLEQMFDVFDAAATSIPASVITKGQSGSIFKVS